MTGFSRETFVPGVYMVTDTGLCGSRGVIETVRAAVNGGIRTVQVREKEADVAEFYQLVLDIAEAVGDRATVLVNDRVDVYLAARAVGARVHGIHLGQGDLPIGVARTVVGDDAIMGLTANTPAHISQIGTLPEGTVDYLGVGVIRATSTKPDHPLPLGIEGFAAIAGASRVPCVAIGGIVLRDVSALRRAEAAGVAVVSTICSAADPTLSAGRFIEEWNS